ncbi:DUF6089 family protein [Limibacter armeniacum]|uniref:DUF6089 family protein n=1 Tax=Limibacter armeniacum TaxID=466084 RepID=UPI002FE67CDE
MLGSKSLPVLLFLITHFFVTSQLANAQGEEKLLNVQEKEKSIFYKPQILTDRYLSLYFQVGTAHYYGDLSPSPSAFGTDLGLSGASFSLGAEKQFTQRLSASAGLSWSRIKGDDAQSSDPNTFAYARNLHFRNDIWEIAARGQFNVFRHTNHFSERPKVNPYLFAGLGFYVHNPQAKTTKGNGDFWVPLRPLQTEGQSYSRLGFTIPYGAGVNFRLNDRFDLGVEFGFRATFTDYLDDVSNRYIATSSFEDNSLAIQMADRSQESIAVLTGDNRVVAGERFSEGDMRGDPSSKDGYFTAGVKLKYIISKNKPRKELSKLHNMHFPTNGQDGIWKFERKTEADQKEVIYRSYKDRYTVMPLAVNTEHSESMPAYYKGGILFASDKNSGKYLRKAGRKAYYNFYYSPIHDIFRNEITRPVVIEDQKLNGFHHEGATSWKKEGKVIIAVCDRQNPDEEMQQYQFYEVEAIAENNWQFAQPLPFNSDKFSVSQPSLSEDGNTLYFVSDMEGGYGGTDIYVSYKYKGQWTYPMNLGEPVNTAGNELTPFIHKDSTLYFASDGHLGLGGLDMYEATSQKDEGFNKVVNLGAPVNSSDDDFGLILNSVKREGYFTSNRRGGKGGNDIYQLTVERLPMSRLLTGEDSDMIEVIDMKLNGAVMIKDRKVNVAGALVTLTNVLDDTRQIHRTDRKGNFSFDIKNENIYELSASVRGYKRMEAVELSTVGIKKEKEIWKDLEVEAMDYRLAIKGNVTDVRSGNSLRNVKVTLLNLHDDKEQSVFTDKEGTYRFKLEQDCSYVIFVSEEGYEHKNYDISTFNIRSSGTIRLDISLNMNN